MNIVVCLKQVPHPDYLSKTKIDFQTGRLKREGIPLIINPPDKNAIELGLVFREKYPGKLTVISMGPPSAKQALTEALSMGADEGFLLCDQAFVGADSFATAFTLAGAIRKLCPADLVICGNETSDSGTAQVGPQLAEFLDIPHVTNVSKTGFSDSELLVEKSLENGSMEVRVRLPALLTVTRQINEPRIPNIFNIMSVASKPLETIIATDIDIPLKSVGLAGSMTLLGNLVAPESEKPNCVLMDKDVTISVTEAVQLIRDMGVI